MFHENPSTGSKVIGGGRHINGQTHVHDIISPFLLIYEK
jgi:hypothetical protein